MTHARYQEEEIVATTKTEISADLLVSAACTRERPGSNIVYIFRFYVERKLKA